MARELFMDMGREIMSIEDCIKCYDNGDNTQQSAPPSGENIRVCSRAQVTISPCYHCILPRDSISSRVGGVRGCVIMLERVCRAEVRANMGPS